MLLPSLKDLSLSMSLPSHALLWTYVAVFRGCLQQNCAVRNESAQAMLAADPLMFKAAACGVKAEL